MKKNNKLFNNEVIKGLDEENRIAEYIISSDHVDRYGEIVEQDWELENYNKNPIVLWGHDPSEAENVLGKCIELKVEDGEDGYRYTKAKVKFADEGTSDKVDTVWKLVKQGILKTVSVGFVGKVEEGVDKEGNSVSVLRNNELLEFSIVAIPANPNAVALAYDKGELDDKDVEFFGKSVEKGICGIIKKEKNGDKNKKAKEAFEMTEEDFKKIAEIVENAVKPIVEEIEAIKAEKAVEDVVEDDEDKVEEEEPKKEDGVVVDEGKVEDEEGDDMDEELDEEEAKAYMKKLEEEFIKESEK